MHPGSGGFGARRFEGYDRAVLAAGVDIAREAGNNVVGVRLAQHFDGPSSIERQQTPHARIHSPRRRLQGKPPRPGAVRKAVPSNPHSRRKVQQTLELIRRELEPEPAFKGAVVTESVAQGDAREDSDVDMVLLFEPLRLDVVPGDFVWSPNRPGFRARHERSRSDADEVHFDTTRVGLDEYQRGDCAEEWRYLLSTGLLIFDRDGEVEPVLDRLIEYPAELRRRRVGESTYYVDYHLSESKALGWLERSGAVAAHAHITAGMGYLVELIYAYHATYLTWPNKRIPVMLRFPDPAGGLERAIAEATLVKALTGDDVLRRLRALRSYFDRLVEVFQRVGLLALKDPFDHAFAMAWPEIGLRHSMEGWRAAHERYLAEGGGNRAGEDRERPRGQEL